MSKTQIKSKKQKHPKNVPVIQLVDSDSSNQMYKKPINKIQRKTQTRPNSFNLERLTKITPPKPLQANSQSSQLQIEQCFDPFEELGANKRSLLQYKKEGSQQIQYTNNFHLFSKVQNCLKQKAQENLTRQQQEDKQPPQEKQNKSKPNFRYFSHQALDSDDIQDQITCFRCNNKGHIAKNCTQQAQKRKCMFCLGDHQYHLCNSNLCFKCGKNDHLAQMCNLKNPRCNRCGKLGHIEKDCGVIIFMDFHKNTQKQIQAKFNKSDLKKLKCLSKCGDPSGHFNCEKYMKKGLLLPYEREVVHHKKNSYNGYYRR